MRRKLDQSKFCLFSNFINSKLHTVFVKKTFNLHFQPNYPVMRRRQVSELQINFQPSQSTQFIQSCILVGGKLPYSRTNKISVLVLKTNEKVRYIFKVKKVRVYSSSTICEQAITPEMACAFDTYLLLQPAIRTITSLCSNLAVLVVCLLTVDRYIAGAQLFMAPTSRRGIHSLIITRAIRTRRTRTRRPQAPIVCLNPCQQLVLLKQL